MAAAIYDLSIDEGSYFNQTFSLKNADQSVYPIVGYTAKASLKRFYSDVAPLAVFTCVVDGVNGNVTISLLSSATDSLPFPRPESVEDCPINIGVWDFFIIDPSGHPTRILKGKAFINSRVTA